MRSNRASVCQDEALLHPEFVDRQLEVEQRVHLQSWLHRARDLSEVDSSWAQFASAANCLRVVRRHHGIKRVDESGVKHDRVLAVLLFLLLRLLPVPGGADKHG